MAFSGTSIRKFAPFAAIAAYLYVYWSAGKTYTQIVTDIQNITISRLQEKSGNLIIAAAAAVALYMLRSVKMPAVFKTIILFGCYILIGYNLALVIDPPGTGTATTRKTSSGGIRANPYAYR